MENRAFIPLPIPINLKYYAYIDDMHFNIRDSVFWEYYYKDVDLKSFREFELIDMVSEVYMLKRYCIEASEQFRTINRRISRLFLDEVIENPKHHIVLEYYLNNNRISSKYEAFKLATLDEKLDDIVIDISESRDTCKVNIVW